ncbi:MAG: tetratricopeptide repeat protein [Pseudomonadota bacterium]|nr:tetratricopeptide repeat protein [Pseudomonadota bacterium]
MSTPTQLPPETGDHIFREIDDEIRRDRLHQIWARWGKFVIAACVLAVLATAAQVGFRNWSIKRASERTEALVDLAAVQGIEGGAGLISFAENRGGDIAVLARFDAAGAYIDAGDVAKGADILADVADDDGNAEVWRNLARLLEVTVRLDSDTDPKILAERLQPVLTKDGAFRHSAREMAALLALKSGHTKEAIKFYSLILGDVDAPAGLKARARDMIDHLSG